MAARPGLEGAAGALFGWQLLTLGALDAEHHWLPDRLTGLLAVTGLAVGAAGIGIDFQSRMIGGIAGFASLSIIAWTYRKVRGRNGMGGGDPKMLGAIGCWMGWLSLPFIVIGASVIGICVAVAIILQGKNVAATTRLPLGSLMAIAAFGFWLLNQQS